ncbi:MAG: rhodanese-like domain-containing protein [Bacteroidota bacterium]
MNATRTLAILAVVLVVGYVLFLRFTSGGEGMTPAEFVASYEPEHTLIDARTPREYNASHLSGAINLDVMDSDFREQAERLPRDQPVYLYCASGTRSGRAAGILEAMGFTEVYNVGGLDALAAAGAEVEISGPGIQ